MDRILLVVALALTQAQTAPATTTPVSRDELKKSLEKLTGELEKTKSETESIINERKESSATKPKVKLVLKPVKKRERVKKKRQSLSVPKIEILPKIETVNPERSGELIIRSTIPTVKVVKKPSEPKPATRPGKSFWKKLWHILPFRFFGEH